MWYDPKPQITLLHGTSYGRVCYATVQRLYWHLSGRIQIDPISTATQTTRVLVNHEQVGVGQMHCWCSCDLELYAQIWVAQMKTYTGNAFPLEQAFQSAKCEPCVRELFDSSLQDMAQVRAPHPGFTFQCLQEIHLHNTDFWYRHLVGLICAMGQTPKQLTCFSVKRLN